jgi:hypothetical protein
MGQIKKKGDLSPRCKGEGPFESDTDPRIDSKETASGTPGHTMAIKTRAFIYDFNSHLVFYLRFKIQTVPLIYITSVYS